MLLEFLHNHDPAVLVPHYFTAISPGIVKVTLSLLIVYPLAYIHRELVHKKSKFCQLLYFLVSGGAVIYYVIGKWGFLHCLFNILLVWMTKKQFGPTQTTVIITAVSTMVYLVIGYIQKASVEVYNVSWTMPLCIHTLKLIGLIFDYKDGNTDPAELTEDQRKNSVKDFSLLEVLSFCFTFTGGLTGPQMSFNRFRQFCEGRLKYEEDSRGRPDSIGQATQRFYMGCIFILGHLLGGKLFKRDIIMHPNFHDHSLLYRWLHVTGFSQVVIAKYVGCWTVMEGACTLLGISYDPSLPDKWGAMRNVNLGRAFTGCSTRNSIANFNITTKHWIVRYLFKRNKDMGKWSSILYTYLFIILWHGVLPGYWLAFLFQMPLITGEKQLGAVLNHYFGEFSTWDPTILSICRGVARIYIYLTTGYGFLAFILLTWKDSIQMYNGFYWCWHIILGVWLLTFHLYFKNKITPLNELTEKREAETMNKPDLQDKTKSN